MVECVCKSCGRTFVPRRSWRAQTYCSYDCSAAGRKKTNPDRSINILFDGDAVRWDAAARLKEIPPDTRDSNAFLTGLPLPGRSALDRKLMERGR